MNRNVEKAKRKLNKDHKIEYIYDRISECDTTPIEKLIDLASTPDWHLVSENDLPKEAGVYLVIRKNEIPHVCVFHKYDKQKEGYFAIDYVIAWTYLPKYEPK